MRVIVLLIVVMVIVAAMWAIGVSAQPRSQCVPGIVRGFVSTSSTFYWKDGFKGMRGPDNRVTMIVQGIDGLTHLYPLGWKSIAGGMDLDSYGWMECADMQERFN